MKLARYQDSDGRHWGSVDTEAGTIHKIAGDFSGWAPILTRHGSDVMVYDGDPVALDSVRLLKPLSPTSKVLGTGVNYISHLVRPPTTDQQGPAQELPPEISNPKALPTFIKPMNAIIGPDELIRFPAISQNFSHELELVVVMGGVRVGDREHGIRDVLGYTIGIDSSAYDVGRMASLPSRPLTDLSAMKGLTRSSPMGPWITTKDELGGEEQPNLLMTLSVNGEQRQSDQTGDMLWGINRCVAWMDERYSLTTGDIFFTGSTGGVGSMTPGDLVECEIEGIGILRNTVGAVE
ncbi:MAG: hydrolase family protein [Ilumatobacteraceae bacterium]|nr:hydrolase family protein [Ilumatobacteraceae bacterium]